MRAARAPPTPCTVTHRLIFILTPDYCINARALSADGARNKMSYSFLMQDMDYLYVYISQHTIMNINVRRVCNLIVFFLIFIYITI